MESLWRCLVFFYSLGMVGGTLAIMLEPEIRRARRWWAKIREQRLYRKRYHERYVSLLRMNITPGDLVRFCCVNRDNGDWDVIVGTVLKAEVVESGAWPLLRVDLLGTDGTVQRNVSAESIVGVL